MATSNAVGSGVVDINAQPSIEERAARGRIPWSGPLLLIVGRSVFLAAGQAIAALILLLRGDATPWESAGHWWTVYGTLADLGCLGLMWRYTRGEGVTLRSLLGRTRWRRGHDIWFGLALCLLIFPLIAVGGMFANWLVFGKFIASPSAGASATAVVHHALPLWRTIYSLSVWWLIWTPTEQLTYQAYALPRLIALTRRTWAAFALVGFFWTLQHIFNPFVPDWRNSAARFLMVIPGLIAAMLIYLRTRRLVPMIVAQWPMDIFVAVLTAGSR